MNATLILNFRRIEKKKLGKPCQLMKSFQKEQKIVNEVNRVYHY